MIKFQKQSVCLALLTILLVFSSISTVFAAGLPERPTCDSDFWDVAKARSTVEAQREIEMAERIILKPDSVLEYTCFNQDLERLASLVSTTLFSANVSSRFFNHPALSFTPQDIHQPTIRSKTGPEPRADFNEGIKFYSDGGSGRDNPYKYPGAKHFRRNVTDVSPPDKRGNAVMAGMYTYLYGDHRDPNVEGNFSHNSLGGIPGAPAGALCFSMKAVWDYARCSSAEFDNSSNTRNKKWFPTFDDIAGDDPRDFPKQCPTGGRNDIWSVAYPAMNPKAGALGGVDVNKDKSGKETAYTKEILTGSCGSSEAVLTGLRVQVGVKNFLPEGVCVMAGCVYYPNSGTCR